VSDDADYITQNPAVVTGAPFRAYFTDRTTGAGKADLQVQSWRPVRTLAFRAIHALAGPRPWAFRLVNLALYAATTVMLLALLRARAADRLPALAAAALWAAAPVHVEPVVYASALGDQLSLVLELAALLASLRAVRAPRPAVTAAWTAAALVALAIALLAKEMAVTAPALLATWLWAEGAWSRTRRRAAILVGAQAVAVLGYLALRTAVLGALGHAPLTGTSFGTALLQAPTRVLAYLRVSLAPLGHHPAYVQRPVSTALALAAWGAVIAAGIWIWRRGRAAALGAAWFAIGLLPVLGLVPVAADMADRFALLSTVGLALLVPPALARLATRARLAAPLAVGALLVLYGVGTVVESAAWADNVTLWTKAAALESNSGQAQRNLGYELVYHGEFRRGLEHLERARALGEPDLAYERAVALNGLGRLADAARAAAEAVVRNPLSGRAHAFHGTLLLARGDQSGAARELELAQKYDPGHPSTGMLQARLAAARGDHAGEVAALDALVARHPREWRFHLARAEALARAGDPRAHEAAAACAKLAPGAAERDACARAAEQR
jgi:tetratricopeptide (TPR) repeat protein